MNVADVHAFSKVASTGSFSIAAKQMGITRSAISKSVSRLENDLGVVFVRRTPRSISLTEAGRNFYRHVLEAENALSRAVDSVSDADQRPSGNVSCSLPSSLGAALTPLLIQEFRPAWPDVTLNLHFDERQVDLVSGSYDVGIRIANKLQDSNLLSRRLDTTHRVLVASPGYLAKHGIPSHVRELPSHRCLCIGNATQPRKLWRFGGLGEPVEVTVDCCITTNTDLPLILAACMDDGILYIPEISVGAELAQGRLVKILPEFCDNHGLGVFAVHTYRKPPAKVRVFVDFVEHALPALKTADRWSPFFGVASDSAISEATLPDIQSS